MMDFSTLKARYRDRRFFYLLNHHVKRYVQVLRYYQEDLRWRVRSKRNTRGSGENIGEARRSRYAEVGRRTAGDLHILHVGYGDRSGGEEGGGGVVDRYASVNILPALKHFGQVREFTVEYPRHGFPGFARAERQKANGELLRIVEQANSRPDVVIGQMSGWMIDPGTLAAIRAQGIPVINYCWDDTADFYGRKLGGIWTGPAALAAVVDLNLTSSRRSCLKYQAEGGLAVFWPEGANPEVHRPYDVPFEYDVSFVGGRYGYRPLLIEFLRERGVHVSAFGPGWEKGLLSPEEMIKLYSRSRINLGFGEIGHMRSVKCLKGRDFEVPMSGGLYLTSRNSELHECYEVGREIVCYNDGRDCLAKIRYLLSHPDEAEAIRKAGRQRALRDHAWSKRLEQVFRIIGHLE